MEKKNYGFKFNPDGSSETILHDANNGNAKMVIKGDDGDLNMPKNYVLANQSAGTKGKKMSKIREFATGNPNVGKGSAGFVGVITLAIIIAIVGAVIAFFSLKY